LSRELKRHLAPRNTSQRASYRIALLFNANKIYDREIISGIGAYLRSTRVEWDLLVEDDFRVRITGIDQWRCDGIIADFDDPSIRQALEKSPLPVVAIGGSYADPANYPKGLPYVATDNFLLVKYAHDHLVEADLQNFAMYSLPEASENRWAQEREKAFAHLAPNGRVYRGVQTRAVEWNTAIGGLIEWISSLEKPIGIIAITDSRARHLLHACMVADIAVPEQVSIVGIDNDPLTQSLTRIGLSSVRQGTHEMGRAAARLLHQMLRGTNVVDKRIVVPPAGLNSQASSKHTRPFSAQVMKARYFIRQFGCQGIKNEQVAEYVGVSRSTLEHRFRIELGSTVHAELLIHRLDVAKELLRNTDLRAAEVANRAGFTSLQYLYTVFKRELGVTPAQFRLKNLLDDAWH
jgi:LacI family transcriptional regulator